MVRLNLPCYGDRKIKRCDYDANMVYLVCMVMLKFAMIVYKAYMYKEYDWLRKTEKTLDNYREREMNFVVLNCTYTASEREAMGQGIGSKSASFDHSCDSVAAFASDNDPGEDLAAGPRSGSVVTSATNSLMVKTVNEGILLGRVCDSVQSLVTSTTFKAAASDVVRMTECSYTLRHVTDIIGRSRKQTIVVSSFRQFVYFVQFAQQNQLRVLPFWLLYQGGDVFLLRETTIAGSEEFNANSLMSCDYPPDAYFFCDLGK